jgi:hypothetical protein
MYTIRRGSLAANRASGNELRGHFCGTRERDERRAQRLRVRNTGRASGRRTRGREVHILSEHSTDPARQRLRDALSQHLTPDQLDALLSEVLAIVKTSRADVSLVCKSCGKENRKRIEVQVPDARAVAGALSDLLTQGLGRPGSSEAEGGDTLIFERHVHYSVPREDGFEGEVIDRPHDRTSSR